MSAESYTIRPARAEDANAVAEMWAEMAREHAARGWQGWKLADDAIKKWRSHFLEKLEKEDYFALIAADTAHRSVGFITARMRDPELFFVSGRGSEITNLVVRSKHRRKGIGRRLTEAALEILISRGAEFVTLGVACANDGAIELYNSLGFRDVTRQMYKGL